MSLAYDASGVLGLCERVFRNDLELDCERDNQRNTVRAKFRIDGTRYTIVCSAMEKAQVLHLWAFLPFDVETEEKAMQMANACKELNSVMVFGKYTYNLEKDVALELAHCFRDGMSEEAARRLIIGVFCASLKEDGQRVIDLHNDKLTFSRFRELIRS
ncbi:MAG TPA: YbjN domain-containing protein [Candidatus Fournierella merdipullorum]|uniref:YbjN domain-containing protein n=1 Tax=Candidatus Allofournierella merdipullorum TaxID=2838595 RepID=A0A9D2IZH0_9FIRM|nr:YbjN domain-containing protein [Candidatus Fournierella merdipullorum]